MRREVAAIVAVCLSGCGFDAEFVSGYRCTRTCPDGQICRDGICVADVPIDAASPSVDAASEPGLVAWYRFEDSPVLGVDDSSGNDHTGACAGTGCPVMVAGRVGNAYQFDGNDYVYVAGGGAFATATAVTIAGWMRLEAGDQTPLSKPRHVSGQMDFNSWQFEVNVPARGCAVGPTKVCADDVIVWDDWQHFAATWDGATKRLFLDGTEVLSTAATLDLDGNDVIIGADYHLDPDTGAPTSTWVFVTGLLDEIRIYDRVLSDDEIAALAM